MDRFAMLEAVAGSFGLDVWTSEQRPENDATGNARHVTGTPLLQTWRSKVIETEVFIELDFGSSSVA